MNFDGTFLFGDCGYNKETSFYLSEKVGVQFVHTTKCGPSLCFIFGKVNYQMTTEQQAISKSGPIISMGAMQAIEESTSFLILYQNGTGCVTFLQSSNPALGYSNIEYITIYCDTLSTPPPI